MAMDEESWARHANAWSVWTRFTCAPLLVLAIWSRVWLGWWALIPIAAAVFWTWWNPRAFPVPKTTTHWGALGTFGERVYLNRRQIPIPEHHAWAAAILTLLSAPGALLLVYGLIVLDPWATVMGLVTAILPKVWFVDRMVWLYQDMKDADPRYASWMRG